MLHLLGVPGSVRLTRAGSVAAVRSLSQIALSSSRRLMVLPRLFDILAWPSRPRIFGVVEKSGWGAPNASPHPAVQPPPTPRAPPGGRPRAPPPRPPPPPARR